MGDDKKKLVPLPPLPKARKLPSMPRVRKEAAPLPVRLDDEVEAAPDNFGGDATGRWFDTGKQLGSVGGRCWKCGRKRKAENLRLWQRPFGKGEAWICKEGC